MGTYEKLLEPIRLTPKVTLKNRMVKAPQATMYWNTDGTVSDRALAAYEAIARGGASMIVVGGVAWQVPPEGVVYCCMHDDRFIPGLTGLADAMHAHDCKIVAQLNHLGPSARATIDGRPPFGPSALTEEELPSPAPHLVPGRALEVSEMMEYKDMIVAAAARAEKAGFDGVEIHAANGYYLASFLTDIWNRRTDAYGTQNIENRTRYVREVIESTRTQVGPDFLVGVRINGQEWGARGCITPPLAAQIAVKLEEAGVDYISVNGYGYGPLPFKYCPDYFPYPEPEDFMKPYMAAYRHEGIIRAGTIAIKHAVKVPVITAGRMTEDLGEEALEHGDADIIAFGRALFADPEMPNKVREGRVDDICHCTRCGTCEDPLTEPRRCRVNPALGRERQLEIRPAAKVRNIMVIGGGPAGMECARVAAQRGHRVTLCEAADHLGGSLELASMIKGNEVEDVMPLFRYLVTQIGKSTVTVRLKTTVTPKLVRELHPDAVVVANGAPYGIPAIPGVLGSNVYTVPILKKMAARPMKLFGPEKLSSLSEKFLPVGKSVVILGGKAEGLQCAVFMRKRGKKVVVIEKGDELGVPIPEKFRNRLVPWFDEAGVEVYRNTQYQEITKGGVRAVLPDGTERLFGCDSVLVMEPQVRDVSMAESLRGICDEVYTIGSALGEGNTLLKDALLDGRKVAVQL